MSIAGTIFPSSPKRHAWSSSVALPPAPPPWRAPRVRSAPPLQSRPLVLPVKVVTPSFSDRCIPLSLRFPPHAALRDRKLRRHVLPVRRHAPEESWICFSYGSRGQKQEIEVTAASLCLHKSSRHFLSPRSLSDICSTRSAPASCSTPSPLLPRLTATRNDQKSDRGYGPPPHFIASHRRAILCPGFFDHVGFTPSERVSDLLRLRFSGPGDKIEGTLRACAFTNPRHLLSPLKSV